ncbi:transketolase family protein [Veillonella sp. R32]|uniref:transketolase family protein n=1 Tax=Veillonella sp. R32 TaxID=2021312 RepID=UPI00138986AB|nr:transketolase C-terminal domain-containing protein [Veillonella sp. R32]KAF1680109.1 transketolase [Veillonella sp. R32]
MRDHVIAELVELGKIDDSIILATADLGFNVVEKYSSQFPNRYINTGIAEQSLTSIAAGLALEGNKVFTYSIGNFPTLRCIEQLRNLVCYHNANVKVLAVGGGFAYGTLGMTHHATEDIAMMRALPKMDVYVPADAIEAVLCLRELYKKEGPGYLRMARGKEPYIHKQNESIDVTKVIPIKESGEDVIILAAGTILSEAVRAFDILVSQNIKCSVYSVPCIKPLDEQNVRSLARKAKLLVTIEEHTVIGGLGGAVAEAISGISSHASLLRFGLNNEFTSIVGSQNYLRSVYHLDANEVAERVIRMIKGA